MKKLILFLLMLSFIKISNAQIETKSYANNETYYITSKEYFKRVTFKIGGGVLLPQGKLNDYFGVSPLIELSVDFPVTKKKSLEFALQFIVPSQKDSFKYVRTIDTIQAKASFIINPMLRFKKNLTPARGSKLEIGLGLGGSMIKTNARNPFYTGSEENDEKYEVVAAFLVSPSLDYVKTFNSKEQFTFGFGVNYSPYKVEGALRENIGSISFTPKLMYSF